MLTTLTPVDIDDFRILLGHKLVPDRGGGGRAMDIYVHAVKSLAEEPARFVLNNMYNVRKIHVRNVEYGG